jgi:hypothetical protein
MPQAELNRVADPAAPSRPLVALLLGNDEKQRLNEILKYLSAGT